MSNSSTSHVVVLLLTLLLLYKFYAAVMHSFVTMKWMSMEDKTLVHNQEDPFFLGFESLKLLIALRQIWILNVSHKQIKLLKSLT